MIVRKEKKPLQTVCYGTREETEEIVEKGRNKSGDPLSEFKSDVVKGKPSRNGLQHSS